MTCNIFAFFSICCINNYKWHFCNCNFFSFYIESAMWFHFHMFLQAGKLAVDRGWAINVGEWRRSMLIMSVILQCVQHIDLFGSMCWTEQVWLDLWLKSSEFLMKDVVFLWTGLTIYFLMVISKPNLWKGPNLIAQLLHLIMMPSGSWNGIHIGFV